MNNKIWIIIMITSLWVCSGCGLFDFGDDESPGAIYTVNLNVSNGSGTLNMAFGQSSEPAALDEEAPPAPPQNALHAYFERDGKEWLGDFRDYELDTPVWRMRFQADPEQVVTLSWTIEVQEMDGVLSLLGHDGAVLVGNMQAQNSFSFSATQFQFLQFSYE